MGNNFQENTHFSSRWGVTGGFTGLPDGEASWFRLAHVLEVEGAAPGPLRRRAHERAEVRGEVPEVAERHEHLDARPRALAWGKKNRVRLFRTFSNKRSSASFAIALLDICTRSAILKVSELRIIQTPSLFVSKQPP